MSLHGLIFYFVFTTVVFVTETNTNVIMLNSTNFYHLVDKNHIWAINFHSKNKYFDEEFALSSRILKGIVKFGAINIEDNVELAKNFTVNTESLPVITFYNIPKDGTIQEYTGPKTTKDLVESILTNIVEKVRSKLRNNSPDNFVKEVNDNNFDKIITYSNEPWMVLFYAPWCVHCKELKPIWAQAARSLQKQVNCASIDATVNIIKATEYGIQEYPTIKLFPLQKKTPTQAFGYTGDRTVDSIVNWVLRILPAPDTMQIINAEVFQKHCMGQKLCVISILPSIFDCQAKCRNKYLDMLKALGEAFKRERWGWVWTEAGVQGGMEGVLDIGGFGYPALVVLNPIKMKYSVFKGAFTKSSINEFLNDAAIVKAATIKEDLLKKIVNVEAWDGKDSITELPEELYLHDIELDRKDEL